MFNSRVQADHNPSLKALPLRRSIFLVSSAGTSPITQRQYFTKMRCEKRIWKQYDRRSYLTVYMYRETEIFQILETPEWIALGGKGDSGENKQRLQHPKVMIRYGCPDISLNVLVAKSVELCGLRLRRPPSTLQKSHSYRQHHHHSFRCMSFLTRSLGKSRWQERFSK